MAVIYEIIITKAICKNGSKGQYDLYLEWSVNQSPGVLPETSFYALSYLNGDFYEAYLIETEKAGCGCAKAVKRAEGTVEFKVSAARTPETAASYPSVPVPQESYSLIKAEYNGEELEFTWSCGSDPGELCLSPLEEGRDLKRFCLLAGRQAMSIPSKCRGNGWLASFYHKLEGEKKNWISQGISTEYIICGITPVLKSVDMDNKITVLYEVPTSWECVTADHTACCALLRDGEEYYRQPVIKPEKKDGEENTFCLSMEFPDEPFNSRLSAYTLAVYCGSGNTLCTAHRPSSQMPLQIPAVKTEINKEGESVLSWNFEGPEDGFSVLVDGKMEQVAYVRQQTYSFEEVKETTGAVAALYGSRRRRGPWSAPVNFLKKGFYPDQENGALRYMGKKEGTMGVSLGTSLFKNILEKTVVSGPFQLEEKSGNCVLTIDFSSNYTSESLNCFIVELFRHEVIPAGYYRLREILSRICPVPAEEVLTYYCGARKNGLSMELMPGLTLKTETAYYNRQSSPGEPDNNGFIRGAVGEYPVTLTGGLLEMDSLFQHVVGSWAGGANVAYPIPAAGLNDFFYGPVRSPYLRLCYPKSFPDSSRAGTAYAADNICIMALNPSESVPKNLDQTDRAGLLLRGRTSVTLTMNVFVNGGLVSLSPGTTLAGVLSRYGASIRMAQMKRKGPEGLVPVYLGTVGVEQAENLVLLPGDRIEV